LLSFPPVIRVRLSLIEVDRLLNVTALLSLGKTRRGATFVLKGMPWIGKVSPLIGQVILGNPNATIV
jgi:hypothetical protein